MSLEKNMMNYLRLASKLKGEVFKCMSNNLLLQIETWNHYKQPMLPNSVGVSLNITFGSFFHNLADHGTILITVGKINTESAHSQV